MMATAKDRDTRRARNEHPSTAIIVGLAAITIVDLVLLGAAFRLGNADVRDGAGSVTTGVNVALSITGTIFAALALQLARLPAQLRAAVQIYALSAQAAHAAGHLARWYYTFWWYDDALHILAILGASILALRVAQALALFPARHATPARAALVTITVALALASVWEIFEFTMDDLQGTREQDDLVDTMRDMTDGALGGAIGAAYAVWRPRPGAERGARRTARRPHP